jgi:hypothetical protein
MSGDGIAGQNQLFIETLARWRGFAGTILLTAALPMGRRAPNGSPVSAEERQHPGVFDAQQSIIR